MSPVYDLSKGQIIDTSLSPQRRRKIINTQNKNNHSKNNKNRPTASSSPLHNSTNNKNNTTTTNTPKVINLGNPYPYHRSIITYNNSPQPNNTTNDNHSHYSNNSQSFYSEFENSYVESDTDASESPSAEEEHIKVILNNRILQKKKEMMSNNHSAEFADVEFCVNTSIAMSELHSLSDHDIDVAGMIHKDDNSSHDNNHDNQDIEMYQDAQEESEDQYDDHDHGRLMDTFNSHTLSLTQGHDHNMATTSKTQRHYHHQQQQQQDNTRKRRGIMSSLGKGGGGRNGTKERNKHNVHQDTFKLHQDTYTFLFLSPCYSWSFSYGMMVFLVQLCIFIIIIQDLLLNSNIWNPFNVPVSYYSYQNHSLLIVGQIVGLFISIFTNKHFMNVLEIINIPYNYDDNNIQQQCLQHATKIKWYGSYSLRFIIGISYMVISFLFITQSTSVFELFLNFAAVQFVSWLDEGGFLLAHRGFSMQQLKVLTKQIQKIEIKYIQRPNQSLRQRLVLGITLFILFATWTYIQIQKGSGNYFNSVCQQFEINFDQFSIDYFKDECNAGTTKCPQSWIERTDKIQYTSFNDVYEAQRDLDGTVILYNQRPMYYQRGLTGSNAFGDDSPPGKIFYCQEERAWVFAIEGVNKGKVDQNDGGCNWLMKSRETDAHSLHEVDSIGWTVWNGMFNVAKSFTISCIECTTKSTTTTATFETLDIGCTYHGQCVNKKCVCSEGWMGSQCESCVSCSEIDIFNRNSQTVTRYRRFDKFDPRTNMVSPLQAYGRPVYYKVDVHGMIDSSLKVIFYDGGRYVAWDLEEDDQMVAKMQIENMFENFHSTWDFVPGTKVMFVSEFTDALMPFGLKWKNDSDENENTYDFDFSCPNEEERNKCGYEFNRF